MPYLEVIPLRKLPPQFSFLDYFIKNELIKKIKIGQLVNVPFKKGHILAIVNKVKSSTSTPLAKIKNLEKIVSSQKYLSANQLALFNFLAKFYFVSPTLFIKTLVPHPPKRIIQAPEIKWLKINEKLQKEIKVEKILQNKSWVFIYYQNYQDRIIAYLSLCQKILENQQAQILIITPTKKELKEIIGYLLTIYPKNYLSILTSELTNNQLYFEWQKIKNGQVKIIIGTKIAYFAPFLNLKLIIIDQEHHENHQQTEINPRYDGKIVSQTLAKLTKAKLVSSSFAPSLESYWQIKNKIFKFITLKNPQISPSPLIIDLKPERTAGNYQLISEKLLELIKMNLKNNKKILLFHNRRGYSPLTICQDCGEVASCPNCQLTLSFHKKNDKLICHRCNYQQDNWLTCPHCHSLKIKQQGIGTEKIKLELQKNFPQENIIIYDTDYQENLKIKNAHLVIGTKYALDNLNLSEFGLIGVILVDSLFNQSDYRSLETTYQLLKSLTIYPNLKLIIQTFSVDNYVLKYFNNFSQFYQEELAIRQKFHYPPYYQLAKFIYKNKNENILDKEINESYKKIKELPKKYPDLEIIGPFSPFPEKVRNKFRKFIIIKYQKEETLAKIINLIYNEKILLEKSPLSLSN